MNIYIKLFIYFLCILKSILALDDSRVRISMIGDILMQRVTKEAIVINNSTNKYNFDYMFEKFNVDIKKFDVNLVNLEILLCAKKFGIKYFPRFSNRFEIADSLVNFGYNVILKATNHAYDYRFEGLSVELNEWKEKYPEIPVTGAYLTKEDSENITYVTKKGIKMAIINFTKISNKKIQREYSFAINMGSGKKLTSQIKRAKKEGAEYIIVCIHWGKEYSNVIRNYQTNLVKRFYALGVDLVLGTHPHVIQPVEWYQEEGNDKKMLVFYSLGNFINSTNIHAKGFYRVYCNGMAYIEIERNKKSGKIETKVGKFIPIVTHIEKNKDLVQTYLVKDYTPALAKENRLIELTDSSFNYKIMMEYFSNIVKSEFLDFNFPSDISKNIKGNHMEL